MRNGVHWLVALALSGFLSLHAWGQTTGEIRGTVTDSSHKPVVSAFVVVTSNDNASMRAASTDESGMFQLSALPVGLYELQVKADDFAPLKIEDVKASIGQVVTLNLVLSNKTEQSGTVQVGNQSMIEASNVQLGVVMDSRDVSALPLKSRDAFDLLQLQPGVQGTLGADLFFGNDQPGVVSVNGARSRSNSANVNGGVAGEQMVNSPAIEPSPDSIEEFRVLTHSYDASLGRNSGSVLNVVTRSGGQAFHGNLFEFLRNDVLNARGYFDPATADFKQNVLGGTIGGPIRKNETFFFGSYEGQRLRRGIASDTVVVPTTQERAGNFSADAPFTGTLDSPGVAQALSNRPGCQAAVQAQGGPAITPGVSYASIFPNNNIPTACFDPTGDALLRRFVPGATDGGNIFLSAPDAKARLDQITFRLDHNLTSQQQLSLYYYGVDKTDNEPFSRFSGTGANLPGFGYDTRERFQHINLSHLWTITSRISNEAKFVYLRQSQPKLASPTNTGLVRDSCSPLLVEGCFSDPSDLSLGITPGYGAKYEGVPSISLAGGFSIGNNPAGSFSQTGNIYQAIDTYSRIIGNHVLKFGVDYRDQRLNQLFLYNINGSFIFSGGGPNDIGSSSLLPNYLLGIPDTYSQGAANAVDSRATQLHLFVQDTWKIKPNLIADYGLRWELNTPQADAGKRVQAFRPGVATKVYPCQLSSSDPLSASLGSSDCSPTGLGNSVFPFGLVFPDDTGVSSGLTKMYWKAFAPRVGLAWSPNSSNPFLKKLLGNTGKSSIRAGWGMFYDSNEELILANFAAQPPFGGSVILSNVMLNTPFVQQDGTVAPNPFHGFLDPKPGSPVDFALFRPITLFGNYPATLRDQYANHYHVTLQREFGQGFLWQIGYVGSQAHRLLANLNQNPGIAQTCLDLNKIPGQSCGPFGADGDYTIPVGAIPAGVTLHLPYGSTPSVTGPNPSPITLVGLRQFSSPMCQPLTGNGCPQDGVPVFGNIFGISPVANSSYNSLQTLLKKRFSHGVQFLASYTWSKSLDNASSFESAVNPLDPTKSRSLSFFDARHRFVLSEVWDVPGWQNSRWAREVTNGWSISSILTLQSGFPIHLTSSKDLELMNSFNYDAPGEPNQVAPFRRLEPQKTNGYYFDPSSFVDAPMGQIGNAPRSICCGSGTMNLDLGIHKEIAISERSKIEFRTEVFNVFNHTEFFNPDGDFADGGLFGRVSRARDPRLIQLALKLSF